LKVKENKHLFIEFLQHVRKCYL